MANLCPMRKLKLIWDFRGTTAEKIAEHHCIHLNEYASATGLNVTGTGTETLNELHSIAYMVIDETDLKSVRDALKPHRGQSVVE